MMINDPKALHRTLDELIQQAEAGSIKLVFCGSAVTEIKVQEPTKKRPKLVPAVLWQLQTRAKMEMFRPEVRGMAISRLMHIGNMPILLPVPADMLPAPDPANQAEKDHAPAAAAGGEVAP